MRPTVPRYGWDVVESVSTRKLKDILNSMSEKGWTLHSFLRSAHLGKWDVAFYRLEHIGKRDEVNGLIEDNPLPPFQGARE